ncbi:PREDICTED: agamous-like MADS-box protein AGL80 [Nicotiana attenuata]|uniref:Agamous-like mads-box protein agl80 n=1 Tax=Nicotiana attenuata TaxID=49451 RepID=A0A1J6IR27_NICAT|nr:PREDICTED: agamous-like MADS-box protein AGL80 [Nicotiana attenuata]OIT07653.1 agamous-like mads-box protein agl80 [Nicotiana attenuata]
MGRAKLKMELISKEKARNATFKKRKEGLMKKLYEFTTLCNVNGCMIMYGPKQSNGSNSEPEIWTNNSMQSGNSTNKTIQVEEIQNLIDEYKKESSMQSGSTKTFGLSDYFIDRNKKVEEELIKLKKMNMQKKYPCWLEFMNQLSEVKLREFLTLLDDKVEKVKSRIDLLKGNFSSEGLSQLTHYNDNVNPLLVQGGMEYGGNNFMNNNQEQGAIYPYCNSIINHQEMMMLMMNENDWQYNGASSSSSNGNNNMRCALMKYETMMSHNMMLNNQMPYSPYVAPTILQPAPYMMMPSVLPQMYHPMKENERDEKLKLSPYLRQ